MRTAADRLLEREDALASLFTPVHDALRRELGSISTLLVLEDLHWGDEATLDVIRMLGRRMQSVPALELKEAAARSAAEGEQMSDVAWIRTYVFEEPDGTVGTVCIYQAESPRGGPPPRGSR